MSHLLPRSKRNYEATAANVRQTTLRMKKFNEETESIQLEHKRTAVDEELVAVRNRVVEELTQSSESILGKKLAALASVPVTHDRYVEPADKEMIVVHQDGNVQGIYGLRPGGPKILTRDEFVNLIETLRARASTEQLSLDLAASEIVRRYLAEFHSKR